MCVPLPAKPLTLFSWSIGSSFHNTMGKNKKKKDKNQKNGYLPGADLEAEVQRLREENEALRARLEKIAELASDFPDDEVDEEEPAGEPEADVNPS